MILYDKDIREPLFLFLEERYGKARIIEEKEIRRSRADVMLVVDNAVIGLEIKSDADTYARLKRQIRDYNAFFDMNYVVIGQSHMKHIEEHVPDFWGIISCEPKGEDIVFDIVREAEVNKKRKMKFKLSLLWHNELSNISKATLKFKYTHISKEALREKLIEKVDEDTLNSMISEELFNRDYTIHGW